MPLQLKYKTCFNNLQGDTIYLDFDFGKEVIILKSGLSRQLFEDFTSNYQACPKQSHQNSPFVFVTHDGSFKLITNVVDSLGGDDEIFALAMAEDGFMEFLAFQD